jgi:hypothetical protein
MTFVSFAISFDLVLSDNHRVYKEDIILRCDIRDRMRTRLHILLIVDC